jgi:putative ABC transport system permease protein
MKYLIKRSLRVIKDTFTQFLAIILIIAIGSAIFTGLLSTIRNLNTYLSDYYKNYHLADAWVYVSGMDRQTLLDYQSQYPDVLIEGRYRFQVDSVLHGTSVTYRFIEPSDINRTQLISGSLPINDNERLMMI